MDKVRREKMIRQAAEFKADRGLANGGVVVFWRGRLQGWTRDLSDESANRYRPGCIALDTNGNFFKAVGGGDEQGAERWELIYGKLAEVVELRETAASSVDRALAAVDEMSDSDAIASLDPAADADAMQSALILVASQQPAASDMLKVLAARGRQRCRDWEIVLDGMSPHASADDLLTLFITGPSKAPSMAWLGQHIKRLQQVAA